MQSSSTKSCRSDEQPGKHFYVRSPSTARRDSPVAEQCPAGPLVERGLPDLVRPPGHHRGAKDRRGTSREDVPRKGRVQPGSRGRDTDLHKSEHHERSLVEPPPHTESSLNFTGHLVGGIGLHKTPSSPLPPHRSVPA